MTDNDFECESCGAVLEDNGLCPECDYRDHDGYDDYEESQGMHLCMNWLSTFEADTDITLSG